MGAAVARRKASPIDNYIHIHIHIYIYIQFIPPTNKKMSGGSVPSALRCRRWCVWARRRWRLWWRRWRSQRVVSVGLRRGGFEVGPRQGGFLGDCFSWWRRFGVWQRRRRRRRRRRRPPQGLIFEVANASGPIRAITWLIRKRAARARLRFGPN